MKYFTILTLSTAVAFLLLSGCGSSGKSSDNVSNTQTDQTVNDDYNTVDENGTATTVSQGIILPEQKFTDPDNWYVNLKAEIPALGLTLESILLGAYEDEVTAKVRTLEKGNLSSACTHLSVAFQNPPVKDTNGSYATNFQVNDTGSEMSWSFELEAAVDDPLQEGCTASAFSGDLTLSLKGLYRLIAYEKEGEVKYSEYSNTQDPFLQTMKIVDLETNVSMPLVVNGVSQSYTFHMDGTHRFAFVRMLDSTDTSSSLLEARMMKINEKVPATVKSNKTQNRAKYFDLTALPKVK